jgi:tetratricopeptide (TPR) repeat protein
MRLAPEVGGPYMNLGNCLLAQQRFSEAKQIEEAALARNLDDYVLRSALYAVAFLSKDTRALADQRKWFQKDPGTEHFVLSLDADSEAFAGHLRQARELTRLSIESAVRADSKENAAIWAANAAIREAAFGNHAESVRFAMRAISLSPDSQGVRLEAALAFAMAGENFRAQAMARDLDRSFPVDTQVQSLWLPSIQAQLALNRKNSKAAVEYLQSNSNLDISQIQFINNLSCMYSTYVRGQAHLAAGNGSAAATEFQKILDHSGIVWNCWTGALARLGLARAYRLAGDRGKAQAAYEDFLSSWRDADADIPVLRQAKAEYSQSK